LEFLKYWPSSRDFNKLVIKAKIHANTYFWICFVVWKYNMIFYFWDLAVCMKTKKYFFYFSMFWWKLGILIPYLYIYGIKIQTNTKQNSVEKIFNFFRWAQLEPCGWAGPSNLNPVSGPSQWPDWLRDHAHMNLFHACINSAKVIKLHSHSVYAHL